LENNASSPQSAAQDFQHGCGLKVRANEPCKWCQTACQALRQQNRFLSIDEVTRLLEALEEPVRTLVLTAALTGMRIGEMLALRWGKMDFDRKVIRVREAVYEGHNSTPKTQGGIRDVPIGPVLEQALRQHNGRRRTADDSLVFRSRSGTHLRPGNLHRRELQHTRKQDSSASVGMISDARDVAQRHGRLSL
jgi:integrase